MKFSLTVFTFLAYQLIFGNHSDGLRNISVNDGLTHTSICGVVQDLDGVIWVGTLNGLCKYDGFSIEDIKNSNRLKHVIPDHRLNRIFLDSQNRIWLAGKETSISYFNPRTNEVKALNIKLNPYDYIIRFVEDSNANIWFTTKSGVLGKIYANDDFIKYKYYQLPKKELVKNVIVANEKVYAVSTKGNLYISNTQEEKFTFFDSNSHYNNIYFESAIGIVLELDNGLQLLEEKLGVTTVKTILNESITGIVKIAADKNKNFYLATTTGEILIYYPTVNGVYKNSGKVLNKGGTSFLKVEDLFIDRTMGLWISTGSKGVYLYDTYTKPFTLFDKNNTNLKNNHISAINEIDHHLWVGTKGGLSVLGVKNYPKIKYHISEVFQDSDANVWVGTMRRGFYLIRNGKIEQHYQKKTKFPTNRIAAFSEDKYGRIWVATYDKGIFVYEKPERGTTNIDPRHINTPTNFVINIYADPLFKNIIWAGTNNKGLLKIEVTSKEKSIVSNYSFDSKNPKSISSNLVKPIFRDSSGILWLGTLGKGLNRMHDENGEVWFEQILKDGNIVNYNVASIHEDNEGFLWLGGEGLSKYDKNLNKFLVYGYKDGLQSNAFKVGADFKAVDGKLYFGGVDGFNSFYPTAIKPNPNGPELVFTDLEINRKAIHIGDVFQDRIVLDQSLNSQKELLLKYDENDFSLNMIATSYINPSNNKFAYKLVGRDKEWINVSKNKRSLHFSNLKYGTYVLQAKAANIDGVWGAVNSFEIKILPPWWQTIWAYVIYTFLLLLSLLAIFLLVKKRQENKLSYLISQKDLEVKNNKIELFTNIAHEIRTPLTLVYSPLKELVEGGMQIENAFGKIEMIYLNTKKLLKLTNGILDFGKIESGTTTLVPEKSDLVQLIQEVNAFFVIGMSEKEIEFNFTTTIDKCMIEFDVDKMEVVVSNLLSNCLKYTPKGGVVKVALEVVGSVKSNAKYLVNSGVSKLQTNYVQLTFQDNGIGISTSELSSIFERYYRIEQDNKTRVGTGIGLSLVKGIVDLHKGEISYKSSLGKGTTCTVKIPVTIDENSIEKPIEKAVVAEVKEEVLDTKLDSLKEKVVLLVEDNTSLMSYISQHLEQYCEVLKAVNGKEGLQLAKDKIPDIIISDVMMPEMNGLEMLQHIKTDPNISFIPVILLTARSFAQYELEGINMGAHDYVTKPFDIKVLTGKLKNILLANEKFKEFYNSNHNEKKELLSSINNKNQEFVNKLKKIITDNFLNEEFTVQTLASEVFMSNSACYKRVKSLTGDSLVKFIRDVRLERAAYLLKEGDLPVPEIARSVGINDLKYFRTKFKDKYGEAPKQYALTFIKNNQL